ncbi:MAG: hypothetical protein PHI97_32845 [Desulfobulbus sp.]|nr:hypothetical protein [Desulfobulbus sp.]
MKNLLPIIFATIAAVGNAMFALGQKKSVGVDNGLIFIVLSAVIAVLLSLLSAPFVGKFDIESTIKGNWNALILSGFGLFFTYLGFNLLYSRYGTSQYVLYAVLSIITTTIIVGVFWLKEPVNVFHKMAIAAVILFSIGQSKT